MANFDAESGLFSMLSYRDPHLARTLRVYRQAAEWAAAGSFDDGALKDAILAVFSSLDRPLSPAGRGYREFASQLQGLTRGMRRELRSRILAVDRSALMSAAGRHLVEGWAESAVAVISSEENLRKANEELGEEALEIERI
jgi:Zn-dependent M16 (insulinase) family peptidase